MSPETIERISEIKHEYALAGSAVDFMTMYVGGSQPGYLSAEEKAAIDHHHAGDELYNPEDPLAYTWPRAWYLQKKQWERSLEGGWSTRTPEHELMFMFAGCLQAQEMVEIKTGEHNRLVVPPLFSQKAPNIFGKLAGIVITPHQPGISHLEDAKRILRDSPRLVVESSTA